ncbi:uncharacterized protein YkwD [Hydrogenispora ethanolica]|jgi:uncharacterized protein YkwD|uniref:Uncharacterized protein YkwD n=1 Tax=Hydrogenispora ethanolica TaxID=1082276 RepID=A0A4R1R4G3_HYDET|nr:CAP domain-containing protein [Hydrogenispora ethanolica]TCL60290.1 uncharacterized protein YkwD [Hydrogenispora ethanolica]
MSQPNTAKSLKPTTLIYPAFIALTFVLTYSSIVRAQTAVLVRTNDPSPKSTTQGSPPASSLAASSGKRVTSFHEVSVLTREEQELVLLINQERSHTGLPELEIDPILVKLAQAKSRDMVSENYFGHISERLGTVYDQLKRAGYVYQAVAENLTGAPNYRKAHARLMSSSSHRGNLLNPRFTRIGVGIVKGGPFGEMITEILVD